MLDEWGKGFKCNVDWGIGGRVNCHKRCLLGSETYLFAYQRNVELKNILHQTPFLIEGEQSSVARLHLTFVSSWRMTLNRLTSEGQGE